MAADEIDAVDYSLLVAVQASDAEPWKKRVHDWVTEHQAVLPGIDSVSLQTVSRRIDGLQSAGYLDSCITRPDGVQRDLIIAYRLTEQGEQIIAEKRAALLEQQLYGDPDPAIDHDVLVELLLNEFDLARDSREVLTSFDDANLVTLFAVFYAQSHIDALLTEDNRDALETLFEQNPALLDSFSSLVKRSE